MKKNLKRKVKFFILIIMILIIFFITYSLFAIKRTKMEMIGMLNTVKEIYDGLSLSDIEYIVDRAGVLQMKAEMLNSMYYNQEEYRKDFEAIIESTKTIQNYARDKKVGNICDELNLIFKDRCLKCHITSRDVQ